jgi:tRNA (cytidine/uridine-2'-O-)-methyltransferase
MLHVVLYQPEIPPNTGNIIRLCANTGATLHLIHPLGFELDEKQLRRAGLDYQDLCNIHEHGSVESLQESFPDLRLIAFSTRAKRIYSECRFQHNDALMFGPETRGLPQDMLDAFPPELRLRLPMQPNNRSLNLSNCVAVAVYEASRQLGFNSFNME